MPKNALSVLTWFVALTLVSVGAIPYASAQTPNGDLSDGDLFDINKALRTKAGRKKKKEIKTLKAVGPSQYDPVQLEVTWSTRRTSKLPLERRRLLDRYLQQSLSRGVPNQPTRSMALVQEASVAAAASDFDGAKASLEVARKLSPDLPAVEFAAADLARSQSSLSVPRILGKVTDGYLKTWHFLPNRFALITTLIQVLLLSAMLFGAAFMVIVLARHLRPLAADVLRVLPRGATTGQVMLAVLLLVVAPGALLGSLVASFLVTVVVVAAHMSWFERVAALALLGLLAVLPQLAPWSDSGYLFTQSPSNDLWTAAFMECDDGCQQALKDDVRARHDDGLSDIRQAILSTLALRQDSSYAETAAAFHKLEGEARSEEVRAAILNNEAVALAMVGKSEESLKLLDEASALSPDDYRPLVNTFRVQDGILKDAVAADATLQRAIAVGGTEAAEEVQRDDKSINLWYAIMSIPSDPIAEAFIKTPNDGEISIRFWEQTVGQLFVPLLWVLASIAALLGLLTTVIGLLRHRSRRCPRCGQEMVPGDPGPHGDLGDSCRICHDFFAGGKMTYQAKVAHEARVSRWEVVSRWTFRLGNVLVPGLGSAVRGSGVGLLVLWLFSMGLAVLLAGIGPLPDVWHLGSLYLDGRTALGSAIIVLTAAMSFALLFVGDPGAPEFIKVGRAQGDATHEPLETELPPN